MPDHYTYPGTEVLVNIRGYTDPALWKDAETLAIATGQAELLRFPVESGFDLAHLQAIHAHLVQVGGAFTSIDGKTIAYLTSNGIVNDIFEGYSLPEGELRVVPASVASAADYPGLTTKTWTQWMNQTAQGNAAPSWSQGLTANPGCVMAPWASSVNGSIVLVTGDTLIDAPSAACATVSLQSMTVKLAGDLTIFATGFSSIHGLRFESSDGLPHIVNLVVPGTRTCGTVNGVNLSAATGSDALTTVNVDAAGKLTVNGTSTIAGKVADGCFAGSGQVAIG